MRKIVIITIILTLIFGMAGCTAHREPDKKAAESSSSNAVFDMAQAEDLSEKTEDETVEKSTFAKETTQPPAAKTDTEKASKEPIFSQTTTVNTEPKQDTHTQTEPPKSEKSEPEITTNTVSEAITAVEQGEKFDIWFDTLNSRLILLEESMIYGHMGDKKKAKECFEMYYRSVALKLSEGAHIKRHLEYLDELRSELEW